MAGSRRARSSGGEEPRGTAKDRALRLLGVRWRSREELRRRLTQVGYSSEDVAAALADLEAVGLVDETRFAREVVKDQASRRMAGDRAIRSALLQKGVDRDEADRAVMEAGDETDRASALAERLAGRQRDTDLASAQRRITGQLVRRGYDHATAREAAARALKGSYREDDWAPEGIWDQP